MAKKKISISRAIRAEMATLESAKQKQAFCDALTKFIPLAIQAAGDSVRDNPGRTWGELVR